MATQPPKAAERLLEKGLGTSSASRSIVGDLNEDFQEIVQRRGAAAARRWYWREALALCMRRGPRTLFRP